MGVFSIKAEQINSVNTVLESTATLCDKKIPRERERERETLRTIQDIFVYSEGLSSYVREHQTLKKMAHVLPTSAIIFRYIERPHLVSISLTRSSQSSFVSSPFPLSSKNHTPFILPSSLFPTLRTNKLAND